MWMPFTGRNTDPGAAWGYTLDMTRIVLFSDFV